MQYYMLHIYYITPYINVSLKEETFIKIIRFIKNYRNYIHYYKFLKKMENIKKITQK